MKRSHVLLLLPVLLGLGCRDPVAPRVPTPQEERREPGRNTGRSLDDLSAVPVQEPAAVT